ncbi:SH3-domain-containing protein [Rickenella mellea]|uniref:SH3-domain-containing protein n=1 Tax=Rickenella mellea TaxID=50990 RepID=A0A4Y7PM55_9AGAM|nr:SH3-domain-containing protein [Rickenella mellea]
MASSSTQNDALLAHIISQTKANIDFLISQNYITVADAEKLTSKLTSHSDSNALSEQAAGLSLDAQPRAPSPARYIVPSTRRTVPPPPSRVVRARALWDYNENGQQPNDLSFHAGDVIEIVTETNADWWMGMNNGKQGLFPSNYVEKIPDDINSNHSPMTAPVPIPPPQFQSGPMYAPTYNATPPPPWNQPSPMPSYPMAKQEIYANPQGPPAPPPGQDQNVQPNGKKNKFGKYGGTMAQAAAGGVGFGAGAAVGSGIINAIF